MGDSLKPLRRLLYTQPVPRKLNNHPETSGQETGPWQAAMQRDAQVGDQGEGQSLRYQNLGSYSQKHTPEEISLQQLEQLPRQLTSSSIFPFASWFPPSGFKFSTSYLARTNPTSIFNISFTLWKGSLKKI